MISTRFWLSGTRMLEDMLMSVWCLCQPHYVCVLVKVANVMGRQAILFSVRSSQLKCTNLQESPVHCFKQG